MLTKIKNLMDGDPHEKLAEARGRVIAAEERLGAVGSDNSSEKALAIEKLEDAEREVMAIEARLKFLESETKKAAALKREAEEMEKAEEIERAHQRLKIAAQEFDELMVTFKATNLRIFEAIEAARSVDHLNSENLQIVRSAISFLIRAHSLGSEKDSTLSGKDLTLVSRLPQFKKMEG